nr:hypothetical protein 8 [Desulfobacteraceae bacterium]
MPERFLASQISRVTPGARSIAEGEVGSQIYGLFRGSIDGLRAFGKTVKTGEPADALSKLEARKYRAITAENVKQLPVIQKLAPNSLESGGVAARAVDLLGEGVRLPGRFLQAEDELWKGIGYRMELHARAYRQAKEEGLAGEAFATRMQEIIEDPQNKAPDIHLAAVDAARYQTFTRPLGEAGQAYQGIVNKVPALRLITPFVRTPVNIMKFGFERTPLAPLMSSFREDVAAGGARRDMALARASLGSVVMTATAVLAASGYITGNGPTDGKMRAAKYRTGWQPYSVKIGDQYYAYSRLEPLGMLLGLAADYSEIAGQIQEGEREKLASAITMAISKNVTSKTFLKGLSEAIEAFQDPDRYGPRYVQRFAGTVVPTGVAQIERTMSPEMSAVNSIMDQIKSRIPGYSDDLPPRRNLWGEPIVLDGGLGPDIISPIYTSKKVSSPIDEEILRLKSSVSMPRETQPIMGGSVRLDPKEYDRLIMLMNETPLQSTGLTLKKSMNQLVKSPEYRQANDDQKDMMIRATLQEARELARMQLYQESPTIQRIVSYQLKMRQEAVQ